jgi:hypothetical protein
MIYEIEKGFLDFRVGRYDHAEAEGLHEDLLDLVDGGYIYFRALKLLKSADVVFDYAGESEAKFNVFYLCSSLKSNRYIPSQQGAVL